MRRKRVSEREEKRSKRRVRVRRKVAGTDRPALVVYRSARHMYAQLVDPKTGRTLGATSTRAKSIASELAATGNVEGARRVGKAIAEIAREKNIEQVVFNRNGFLYHGRVRALAEAAREAGLEF